MCLQQQFVDNIKLLGDAITRALSAGMAMELVQRIL